MDFPPIFLEIREQPCPEAGGGEGAARFIGFVRRRAR